MRFTIKARKLAGAGLTLVGALMLVSSTGCGSEGGRRSEGGGAVIYGVDDRKNVSEYLSNQQVLQWADSVAVLGERSGNPSAICKGSNFAKNKWCIFNTVAGTAGPLPEGLILHPDGLIATTTRRHAAAPLVAVD